MTVEASIGEIKGLTPKQRLFVEAFASANLFERLAELKAYLFSSADEGSISSFIIWDKNKRGSHLPLEFSDSQRPTAAFFLEPTRFDLELLRRISETGPSSNGADLVITRINNRERNAQVLVLQEGPNFRRETKRNAVEEIPTWFDSDGKMAVNFQRLIRNGYYRSLTLWLPVDQPYFEEWQIRQIARFNS